MLVNSSGFDERLNSVRGIYEKKPITKQEFEKVCFHANPQYLLQNMVHVMVTASHCVIPIRGVCCSKKLITSLPTLYANANVIINICDNRSDNSYNKQIKKRYDSSSAARKAQDIPHIKHGAKTKRCVVVKKSLGHIPLHNEHQLLLRFLFVYANPTVGNLCVYGFGTYSVVPVICVNFTKLSIESCKEDLPYV
uniref:Uncharacterized protein n=1 Tax=Glossina palpalis gambiensis TaxID=67801 RepID=A0A1B0BGN8_9MUSC